MKTKAHLVFPEEILDAVDEVALNSSAMVSFSTDDIQTTRLKPPSDEINLGLIR